MEKGRIEHRDVRDIGQQSAFAALIAQYRRRVATGPAPTALGTTSPVSSNSAGETYMPPWTAVSTDRHQPRRSAGQFRPRTNILNARWRLGVIGTGDDRSPIRS